jgi:pSer/pThr/pTyr-binding forkhead associated (FHA) protein
MERRCSKRCFEFADRLQLAGARKITSTVILRCVIPVVAKKNASGTHCLILERGDNITIIDLPSSNGTYINNNQICCGREMQLHDGDLTGIGFDEEENSYCHVFQLCQQLSKQFVPQSSTLPLGSVTTDTG